MADHGNTGVTLPRGATGFYDRKDGPPPGVGLREIRTALHAAARAAKGRAGELREQGPGHSYHTATITDRTGEHVVLCHGSLPWVAFVRERRYVYTDEFVPPPPWARAFTAAGFTVLTP
ncbi:hypothetical protein, partial [Streptomyces sp. UNOC14_S4]|uniref:hypothetical protein n=1 Tax=Streptomyces sp. UNOC14_S4 TaxID=2872340 RepID=UPI001E592CB3